MSHHIRIKCSCGASMTNEAPPTPTIHTCSCGNRFKSVLRDTGWLIFKEGQCCDLCFKKELTQPALSGPLPNGKLFHLCAACFKDQARKSGVSGASFTPQAPHSINFSKGLTLEDVKKVFTSRKVKK